MMNTNDKRNYYEVLEIDTRATLQDIKMAYERSKNAYSGDSAALYSLMSESECQDILNQIEEAYSILGDPDKRKEYDIARGFQTSQAATDVSPQDFMSRPTYVEPSRPATSSSFEVQNFEDQRKQNAQELEFKYQQEHSTKTASTVSRVQAVNKFSLNFTRDESLEQEIENCSEYDGPFLRKIREYKKVTVERMSELTKISKTYIRNIESDEFSKLPADVYTRGFVYQYAKCLKLNPDLVATSYIHHLRKLKNPTG